MREIFVLLFILTCITFDAQNKLHLFSGSGETFIAFADNTIINEIPQASILSKNIFEDTVQIKISVSDKEIINETIYLLDKKKTVSGKEFSYRIEKKKDKYNLIFSGINDIKAFPEPLVPLKPVIDTSFKYKNNVLENYCELKNGKPVYFNNLPAGECEKAMPQSYMNYLSVLMKKAQTDDDKFLIAENTAKNNCLSVSQFNKILTYIPYELEKLKLLRAGYFNLIDKHNRKNIDSSFKMESSKRELVSFFKNAEDYKESKNAGCTSSSGDDIIGLFSERLSVYNNDNERFSVFKKQYQDYCYNTEQVKKILALFIHDRERLDTAKLLYFYCTDKEKFSKLNESFSYTTSFAELQDFIKKQNRSWNTK
jgi:hypothetical protein